MQFKGTKKTIQWLERAYDDRDSWLIFIQQNPGFETLHSDPRFGELLERIGIQG